MVAKTSILQIRIDTELKREAEELFAEIGLDTPSAVRLFFKQSVARNAIPFPLVSASEKTDSQKKAAVKIWQGLTPLMKNPVHLDGYQKFTREELHDRKSFFDTNLFIYAYTTNEPEKSEIIRAFFQECFAKTSVVISTQVLTEFYAVMTKHRYPHEKIVAYLDELISASVVKAIIVQTIEKAVLLKGKYAYSWWDSLILSSAWENARQRVYMRSALAYPKRALIRASGSEKGGWHTRLKAAFTPQVLPRRFTGGGGGYYGHCNSLN
ncbi:MAG: type II toxin-antitoxin system RelB/DinJ family antitoxin [Spirochaetaceae bacterium]|nr:type II toxin-antitoxin system RelB/DinJ family antitoxin [Spirochaetaceae bacterium]